MHDGEIAILTRYWTEHFNRLTLDPQGPDERIFRAFDLWSEGRIPTLVLVPVLARLGHGLGTPAESVSVAFCQHAEEGWHALEIFGSVTRWAEDYDTARWWTARRLYEQEAEGQAGVWGAFFKRQRGDQTWDLTSLHGTLMGAHKDIQSRFDTVRAKARQDFPAYHERNLASQKKHGATRIRLIGEEEHIAAEIQRAFPGSFVIMPLILKP